MFNPPFLGEGEATNFFKEEAGKNRIKEQEDLIKNKASDREYFLGDTLNRFSKHQKVTSHSVSIKFWLFFAKNLENVSAPSFPFESAYSKIVESSSIPLFMLRVAAALKLPKN